MISITKIGTFDTAHKVVGHKGKCKNLHGHTFKYEIVLTPITRYYDVDIDGDGSGMLFDFGVLQKIVGSFVNSCWDHGAILNPQDPLIRHIDTKLWIMTPYASSSFCNPTSENLARELFFIASYLLRSYHVNVDQVTIWETCTCKATYNQEVSNSVQADYVKRLGKYLNEKVKEHNKVQRQMANDEVSTKRTGT